MINIHKKIVVDDHGTPLEVIIPWADFCHIEKILGLDLDFGALEDLRQARSDRENGNYDAYTDLDDI
ncbi:conserved hypothetical protein [Candidatus Magnetomoraceae bacterium gMMP-15]